MERASSDEHSHIYLPEHASSFIQTKLPEFSIGRRQSTTLTYDEVSTREEIDQSVEGIYRVLETTEERLDRRCDDIYFSMDLSISALTSMIEAIQGELVEIQSYIARRPEASASIDRRNNKSTDTHRQTSVDDATNQGRLVQKVTSDMFDTLQPLRLASQIITIKA
ncbi:hypothetical protein F2Q69_00005890 [Brassica cretica]|uniref:Uncharacterized protein n=1 Tax=Brassica cretica TaxID=69181 RepID=A0A8S9P201_BRACR|nr:hypothetical protein F2Q69_00005890 [Brassica cretica]